MADLSLRVAALLLALPVSLSFAAKSGPLPYTLEVQVAYGAEEGAESFREELELQLVRELQLEGCFQQARAAAGPEGNGADLLLLAIVHDIEERTDYDITIAQRDSPHRPAAESRRMIARMEARLELQLRLLPENRTIRERSFGNAEGYRPQLDEDPHYEVQLLMIERLARAGRKFVCKNGGKKLRKEIESARTAP